MEKELKLKVKMLEAKKMGGNYEKERFDKEIIDIMSFLFGDSNIHRNVCICVDVSIPSEICI